MCLKANLSQIISDSEMNSKLNAELSMLLNLSRKEHKNIVQVLYTFRNTTADKKISLPLSIKESDHNNSHLTTYLIKIYFSFP